MRCGCWCAGDENLYYGLRSAIPPATATTISADLSNTPGSNMDNGVSICNALPVPDDAFFVTLMCLKLTGIWLHIVTEERQSQLETLELKLEGSTGLQAQVYGGPRRHTAIRLCGWEAGHDAKCADSPDVRERQLLKLEAGAEHGQRDFLFWFLYLIWFVVFSLWSDF